MTEKRWGECKNCEWWQIEPEAAIDNQTMGLCIDENLQSYQLLVSGESGSLFQYEMSLKGEHISTKE